MAVSMAMVEAGWWWRFETVAEGRWRRLSEPTGSQSRCEGAR